MTPTVADASALIDYLEDQPRRAPRNDRERGLRRAAERVAGLLAARRLATTSVAAFEVWSGSPDDPDARALFGALRRRVYPTDALAARDAGRVFHAMKARGLAVNPSDCLVAAVAHLRGAPVLTSDVHFERIKRTALPGLEVIDARAA